MVDLNLESRTDRNRLRGIIMKAEEDKTIKRDEAGFVLTLVERFRADIEKKIKQIHVLQGELNQLKLNEQIIIQVVENLVKAAKRDEARRETARKLREAREIEEERERQRKIKAPAEQEDK